MEAPDGSHFVPVDAAHAAGLPGLVVYRFGAPLYFANAPLFLDDVERIVTQAALILTQGASLVRGAELRSA